MARLGQLARDHLGWIFSVLAVVGFVTGNLILYRYTARLGIVTSDLDLGTVDYIWIASALALEAAALALVSTSVTFLAYASTAARATVGVGRRTARVIVAVAVVTSWGLRDRLANSESQRSILDNLFAVVILSVIAGAVVGIFNVPAKKAYSWWAVLVIAASSTALTAVPAGSVAREHLRGIGTSITWPVPSPLQPRAGYITVDGEQQCGLRIAPRVFVVGASTPGAAGGLVVHTDAPQFTPGECPTP